MKAKTRKVISLVLAAAMTCTSFVYANADVTSVSTDTAVNADLGTYSETAEGTYAVGTSLYSDSSLTVTATDALTVKAINDLFAIYGAGSSDVRFTSSDGDTVRPIYKIEALESGTLTVTADVNNGKKIVLTKADESYTVVNSYSNDGTEKVSGYEFTAAVEAGTTYYFGGVGTNVYTYSVSLGDSSSSSTEDSSTATTEAATEATTEAAAEETTAASSEDQGGSSSSSDSYTYTVGTATSYTAGEVLYSDSNIKITAVEALTGKDVSGDGTSYAIYGSGSDASKVTASSGNTVRCVLQIEVLSNSADVTVIADVNSGKAIELLDNAYTTLNSYANDGADKAEKYELSATLTAGTYYFGGVGTNVYVYGVNVAAEGGSTEETTAEATTDSQSGGSGSVDETTEATTAAPVEGEVNLVADALTLKVGETGDLNIDLTNIGTPVNNLTFWVTFDPTVATASAVKMIDPATGALYDATSSVDYAITSAHVTADPDKYTDAMVTAGQTALQAGVIKIAFYYGSDALYSFDTDTTVAAITFTGTAVGTQAVNLEVVDCNNVPSADATVTTALTANVTNGSVTVEAGTTGDETTETTTIGSDTLVIGSAEVAPGGTKSVDVVLNDPVVGVNNGTYWVTFDPTYVTGLTITGLDPNGAGSTVDLSAQAQVAITSASVVNGDLYTTDDIGKTALEAGKIKLAFYLDDTDGDDVLDELTTTTTLATLTFTVSDSIPDEAYTDGSLAIDLIGVIVDFAGAPTTDGDYPDVQIAVVDGVLTISKTATGDDDTTTETTTETESESESASETTTTGGSDNDETTEATTSAAATTTEAAAETTTTSSGGSSGGSGSGGSSGGRTTTTTTTEAETEEDTESADDTVTGEDESATTKASVNFYQVDNYFFAYMVGYTDGTFLPQNNITRAETAALFSRLITGSIEVSASTPDFTDVSSDAWYADYVGYLTNRSVIVGYSDGSFGPDKAITRAEFSVILSKFLDVDLNGSAGFSDTEGHWADAYIAAAVKAGWLSGYTDGSFKPNEYITRAEVVSAVNRATGRAFDEDIDLSTIVTFADNAESAWYYGDVLTAANSYWYVTDASEWIMTEEAFNEAYGSLITDEEETEEVTDEEATDETTDEESDEESDETADEESAESDETTEDTTAEE
ncbi:MAG: S-layer homology domain-containing protein [Clostridiales bacterium]|nr:S-layer homology domain-containing protein [Clostridiales bacterium]